MTSSSCLNRIAALSVFSFSVLLAGCGLGSNTSVNTAQITPPAKLNGSVHGGQQPIAGAAIHLYIASLSGYQAPNTDILTTPVLSDATGSFNITGNYTCVAGDQLYITAIGGNPGAGVNANSAEMAALGDCSTLTPQSFININEVTTVGSVFALSPFMGGASAVGTRGSNVAGLVHAFASVHKLVNTTTGSALGDWLPAGAVAPTSTINALADILALCVNSTGDTGAGSSCNTLFAEVTPPNGTLPTDTIAAALLMARNPTLNVAALFKSIPPTSPFPSTLSKAPNDWTLAVSYTTGGFNKPSSTSVDQSGNIWVANAGNDTVTLLTQGGVATTFSGNGLTTPAAVAIDAAGNAWIANSTGSSLSAFMPGGIPVTGSPFVNAGVQLPVSLAFDAVGNLWVANSGSNSVSELSSTGISLQQISGLPAPAAVAIDPR